MRVRVNQRTFLFIVFIVPFLATLLISYFVFDQIPHIQDSIAQVFQAKIFAFGKLYAISHPLKEFFEYTHIINNGRWYSQYPPGHALFLMVGVLLGIPWIINPLLGAFSVIIIFLLGKEIYDQKTGRLAAIFTLLSPFFLFMSSEFMAHSSAMFTIAIFALFFVKAIKKKRLIYACLAGIALGLCTLIRPYTAFALCIPFLVYGIMLTVEEPKQYLSLFVTIAFFTLIFIAFLLIYNQITNGHPFTFGYTVLYGPGHGLGFGKGTWGTPHTFSRGLVNFWDSIKTLNLHLFGWPYISLLPVVILLISRKMRRWDYIFFLSFICLGIAYIFYWYHDLCFGPRFLYEALPFVIILSARAILVLPELVKEKLRIKKTSAKSIGLISAFIIAVLFLYSAVNTMPKLIIDDEPNFYWKDRGYANSYWGVDVYLSKLVKGKKLTNSIVFVQYDYPIFPFDSLFWFGSGFLNNSPGLNNDIIYARHKGTRDTLLMNYYPARQYYLYTGKLRAGRLIEIGKQAFNCP
jgi:asparagine N-glycosylation enzyme membrane subunit Stt3